MKNLFRVKLAVFHFGVSLIIFGIIFYLLKYFWYPEPYFENSGGWQGIKIVASIDLVLGPLLTLIVASHKKSKRELISDIGVIAALQIMALVWGIYTLNHQRPVAVVFWEDSFMTVPAQALIDQNYDLDNLSAFSDMKPPLIYVEKSYKPNDLKKILEFIKNDKIPPHHQTWLYRPLKNHFSDIKSQKLNIDQIVEKNPKLRSKIAIILKKHNLVNAHDALYFLLQSKYNNSVLMFDLNGDYLGYVNPMT